MGSVQTDPRFYAIYLDLAAEYACRFAWPASPANARWASLAASPPATAACLYPDHFISPPWPEPTRPVIERLLQNLRPGVTEVYLHPVLDGAELRAYDPANGHIRAGDDANFRDTALRQMVEDAGVTPDQLPAPARPSARRGGRDRLMHELLSLEQRVRRARRRLGEIAVWRVREAAADRRLELRWRADRRRRPLAERRAACIVSRAAPFEVPADWPLDADAPRARRRRREPADHRLRRRRAAHRSVST